MISATKPFLKQKYRHSSSDKGGRSEYGQQQRNSLCTDVAVGVGKTPVQFLID